MADQISMVEYLVLDDGDPHLVATVCKGCGASYWDRRNACAKCGKTEFEQQKVSNDGELVSFSIVHRAAPNVPTPYVSAVVHLNGGGAVKANLVDVEPTPENVSLGMKVRMKTFVAGTDDDGAEAVAFGYAPI
ncbi:MAG: OB-fold domain-containing protein [Actinomycetota bacterium]